MMVPTTVWGRYLISEDIEDYAMLRQEYQRILSEPCTVDILTDDMQRYYENQTNPFADPTPFYVKNGKGMARNGDYSWSTPSLQSLLKHLISFTIISASYKYISLYAKFLFSKHQCGELEPFRYRGYSLKMRTYLWRAHKERMRRRYYEVQTKVDFSRKFVYVPLHMQPECTTSAMGGIFVDQILMIDILSATLPDGWVLYVKENPVQWSGPRMHVGRPRGYYDEILKRKNIFLVPIGTSTYDLIKNAQAVATVAGVAAWEAVLHGIPALIFGSIWFMYCEGIFRVRDTASVKGAFKKIQNGYVPNKQRVLNFFIAFSRISFKGFHSRRWKHGQGVILSEQENTMNIVDAFDMALKKNIRKSE